MGGGTSWLRLMLNSLSADCIGCYLGQANIKWQAIPLDLVENSPKRACAISPYCAAAFASTECDDRQDLILYTSLLNPE
jgi:hypothetical protein